MDDYERNRDIKINYKFDMSKGEKISKYADGAKPHTLRNPKTRSGDGFNAFNAQTKIQW